MNLYIWRLNLKSLITKGTRRGDTPAMVVIARDETTARELAVNSPTGTHGEDEPLPQYNDTNETDCVLIGTAASDVREEVVVVDHDYDYSAVKYAWAKRDI